MTPDALADLHARCFVTPRPWGVGEFQDLLQSPGVFIRTAPGGFSMGRMAADEAELLTLAVAPDLRRQGLGRALLRDFEQEARARGAVRALLEVSAENAPARALYASAGYRLAGRRPGYYRDPAGRGVDALVLHRELAGAPQ